jgi:hypothetical protein
MLDKLGSPIVQTCPVTGKIRELLAAAYLEGYDQRTAEIGNIVLI